MVKPHEEEQAERLSEREIKTLFTIFFRYIRDTYKQFKWKENIRDEACSIISDVSNTESFCFSVSIERGGRILNVYFSFARDRTEIREKQSFPITGKSPRELGKLAQNMFKWIKQQMEKLG